MAALTLGIPLATGLPRKALVKLGESTSVSSQTSKNTPSLSQKSSKQWKFMQMDHKSVVQAHCSASSVQVTCSALDVRCSAEQQSQSQSQSSTTQTIQRQSSQIANAPTQEKEKTPELDDGGDGGGPGGDDGGGGGGGGGGGWFGGFFFFGFLAFLGFLKDKESEGGSSYVD